MKINNIIRNSLVNNARKSMLESIDGLNDIDFLKKELKEHLRKEFDLQQQINKEKNDKENLIKYLEYKNKEYDIKANGMSPSFERDELITKARAYREILERVKSGDYE